MFQKITKKLLGLIAAIGLVAGMPLAWAGESTMAKTAATESDAELIGKIRSDLSHRDLSVKAQNVNIAVRNGVVTLRGEVNSAQEKNAVGDVAKSYATKVNNELMVRQ